MYNTLLRYVYWPMMVVDVYKHVEQCPTCATDCLSERKHATVMKLSTSDEPFSGLAMDLLGPLPTSTRGHKLLLVSCDGFTKFTSAVPLRAAAALTAASAFIDTRVTAYGIPDSVLTDNGPQFASVYSRAILGVLFLDLNYTPPYYPLCGGAPSRVGQPSVPLDHCVHYAGPLQLWENPLRCCEPGKAPARWH